MSSRASADSATVRKGVAIAPSAWRSVHASPVPPSCSEDHTGQEEKGKDVGEKATRQQSQVSPSGERYLEPAVGCWRLSAGRRRAWSWWKRLRVSARRRRRWTVGPHLTKRSRRTQETTAKVHNEHLRKAKYRLVSL